MTDWLQKFNALVGNKYLKYTIYAILALQVLAVLASTIVQDSEAYKAAEKWLRNNPAMLEEFYPEKTRLKVFAVNSVGEKAGHKTAHFHMVVAGGQKRGEVDITVVKNDQWEAQSATLFTGGKTVDLLAELR